MGESTLKKMVKLSGKDIKEKEKIAEIYLEKVEGSEEYGVKGYFYGILDKKTILQYLKVVIKQVKKWPMAMYPIKDKPKSRN